MDISIQNHITVHDLLMIQIGTQPLLTASPAGYPLIKVAEVFIKALRTFRVIDSYIFILMKYLVLGAARLPLYLKILVILHIVIDICS